MRIFDEILKINLSSCKNYSSIFLLHKISPQTLIQSNLQEINFQQDSITSNNDIIEIISITWACKWEEIRFEQRQKSRVRWLQAYFLYWGKPKLPSQFWASFLSLELWLLNFQCLFSLEWDLSDFFFVHQRDWLASFNVIYRKWISIIFLV